VIELESTGLIYRNTKPHLRAVNAMHPSLARLDDGTMLCAFDLGQGPESLDYATYLSRSADGGVTWGNPTPLTLPVSGPRYANQITRISRVADGTLVGCGVRIYRDDPEEGFVSRETFGYAPLDLFIIRSTDGGQTWTEPRLVKPPLIGPAFEICHGIVELRDGRWLWPTSTWKGWDGLAPNGMRAVAFVSHDRGETWPDYIDVMDRWAQGIIHFEQSLVQLRDGRLLAVTWALHEASGRSDPVASAISEDGRTFASSRSTDVAGQTTKMACLGGGDILAISRRTDVPGLWAHRARIDGNRWVNLDQAPVWQGKPLDATGTTRGEDLANLKCGSPTLLRVSDDTVFAAFWCSEDGITVIRWVRLRAG
jgi:hypothetical protein